MRTIFFDHSGPLLKAGSTVFGSAMVLEISDLNPEQNMTWRMSRWEIFRAGWRLMLAAVFE